MPITIEEDINDTDSEDDLLIFGGLFDTPPSVPQRLSTPASSVEERGADTMKRSASPASSNMSMDMESPSPSQSSAPAAETGPPPPLDDPPSPPASPPPPPPPPDSPPLPLPPPAVSASSSDRPANFAATPLPLPRRWARFNTDLFDSNRLQAYTSARPLPLGW